MPNTFFGLNIGTSGLYTYQAALNTTAHNITNAETAGYTRQVLKQVVSNPIKINSTYGMVGTGVTATGVAQIRNEYYDIKYRNNNTIYGEYSTKEHYMTEIENYFNEVSTTGFSDSFTSLYNSMEELAKNPSSNAVRTQMTNYAESMAEYFNSVSESLSSIQEECNFDIKNKTDQINSIAEQVANLTKQINTIEVGGGTANDLRDSREFLIDELSEIVSVSVTEKQVGDEIGKTSYTVKIGNQVLVNSTNYNTIAVVPRTELRDQNDVEGLYDLKIVSGDLAKYSDEDLKRAADLDIMSPLLSGTLQAVFEVRDGNNSENLKGTGSAAAGTSILTLKNASISDINKLNIPESGVITVGSKEYSYTGFSRELNTVSGEYEYKFQLSEPVTAAIPDTVTQIGDAVDYKGIPYYMSQVNEFVRTFASQFNAIHKTGDGLDGTTGLDFFNATDINDDNYAFVTGEAFSSTDATYYKMTAGNFTVTQAIVDDPSKIAAADSIVNGVEKHEVLDKLLVLMKDDAMFKQGDPESFFQTTVAEIGIDTDKAINFAKNQMNILESIETQRLSVSGVDMDEEAMNLVKFQNAYNLSAKVIQVMDEIYDKLINYMGA